MENKTKNKRDASGKMCCARSPVRRVTSFEDFLPKKRRLPERRGDATQIACENFERKSGACRNIGGNVTQIAFGKYERKSGVCRNVWEDAKV